jgi:hypothetical protein
MTNIANGGPPRQWMDNFANRDGFDGMRDDVGRRNDRRDNVLGGSGAETGSGPLDAGGLARVAAFEKSIRDAARSLDGKAGGDANCDDPKDEPRLLAVADGVVAAGLPVPAFAAPPAAVTVTVDRATSTQAMVDSVTERIQQAIVAAAVPTAGKPLNLHIAFGGTTEGLSGIRLVMTPTALDVVLERTGAELGDELACAAQMLAERLAARFSKQRVRILDAPGAARQSDSGEVAVTSWTMSNLFLPPAG